MRRVFVPKPLGHEQLDRLANQLVSSVAEELFRLAVHEDDSAILADDHHRVGRRFEQASELRLDGAAPAEGASRPSC